MTQRSIDELLQRFGLGEDDRVAWEDSGLADAEFDGWLTDRVARRPAGGRARATYGAPDVHDFARRAILQTLGLGPDDRLLEIGCGGGLLLRDAVAAGAHAAGIDHSAEMVSLARSNAPGAEVRLADGGRLPFADGSFTAVAMSMVLLFFADPVGVLSDCCRVMSPGGRLAVYTISPRMRGTPAAPEPLAAHTHLHTDTQLVAIARSAGLVDAGVADDDGGQLLTARAAGSEGVTSE